MEYPLISVVLPTYNVAAYLQQCLESVKVQTYSNIEVIIIIDGATDGSFEIAKEFCKHDERFSVFWQENAGSGIARNNGLSHCNGEFVMFVDPDDWIEPELLSKLYLAQREGDYDITTSRKQSYIDNNGTLFEVPLTDYVPLQMNNHAEMVKQHKKVIEFGYCSAPTRTLYKMSLIRKNNLRFPSLRRSQDVAFNCLYYQHAQSFTSIEFVGYCYRIIPKTGLARDRSKYHETFVLLYKMFENMYKTWNEPFDGRYFSYHLFEKYFYGSLKLCVLQKIDIKPILENRDVRNVIKEIPTSISPVGITVFLIQRRFYLTTKYFLSLINYLKS